MRDQHLARLRRSADAIGLAIPILEYRWPALLHEAMTRNDVGHERTDAYLRITISRGAGDIGLDPALCPTPTVVIMTKPLQPPHPQQYRTGVQLIVAKTRRNLPSALSPQIKATNFLNNILAKRGSDRCRRVRQYPAQLGVTSDGMHRQQPLFLSEQAGFAPRHLHAASWTESRETSC